jgi:hypothetical protein
MRASSIYNFHFDIVQGCQLRCLGCPNSTLQPKIKRMSREDFERCLGQRRRRLGPHPAAVQLR